MLFILITRNVDLDVNRDVNIQTKRMVMILLAHLFMMMYFLNEMILYLMRRTLKGLNGLFILDLNVESFIDRFHICLCLMSLYVYMYI